MKTVTKKKSKINLQALVNWLYTELLAVNKQVEDDLAKAAKDMHRFLTWGDNACEHAAKQKWLAIYLEIAKTCLKNNKTPEDFLDYISDNLLNENTIAINSGGMHGKMETCDRSTKARIIYEMRQALKYNTFL